MLVQSFLNHGGDPASAGHNTVSGTLARYARVRALTEQLAAPLSEADATVQSMEDASPAKWHLGHVNWFFETFLLRGRSREYRPFDERFGFVFNSYYDAEGQRLARGARGMVSRPSLADVLAWRAYVDEAMEQLILAGDAPVELVELGLAHEEQHQELLLTDIKHAFWRNPLSPALWNDAPPRAEPVDCCTGWTAHPGGVVRAGRRGPEFAFDCEGPRHAVLLRPFVLANCLVTNAQWCAFIADGGYETPSLWLSDGWDWVNTEEIEAPLYWRESDLHGVERFTLSGWQPLDMAAPVSHISQYEAHAFATWAGGRLPTEFEWEALAELHDSRAGCQLDRAQLERGGPVDPIADSSFFGNCWQWTSSAYLPYPGYHPAAGALGEYNGKFMSGQAVLRGASCATPRGHSRISYRNFFHPHQRWQFTGLRLARDL